MSKHQPPSLAQALLRRLVPDWAVEDLLGDLLEVYRRREEVDGRLSATLWAWRQVIALWFRYTRHYSAPAKRQTPRMTFGQFVGDAVTDLRHAFRSLRRSPEFTLTAIIALSLGIGATTAVFAAVNAIFILPLPFADEDRVVVIKQRAPAAPLPDWGLSYPEIENYREAVTPLQEIASYRTVLGTIIGLGEVDRVFVASVSHNYFEVLGVRPRIGRTFNFEDGDSKLAVLSHQYWSARLGQDQAIIGRTLRLDGEPYQVIGVAPPLPNYPNDDALYVLATAGPRHPRLVDNRSARMMTAIGRLRDGASVEDAHRAVAKVATRFGTLYPNSYPAEGGFSATVTPIRHEMVGAVSTTLTMLGATAALVLMLIAANIGNLALARLVQRHSETDLRALLGATRGRLIRYQLMESLWISGIGGAAGALLAYGLTGLLGAWAARMTPHVGEITPNLAILSFALVTALVMGLISTSLPAIWRITRSIDVGQVQDNRTTVSQRWRRVQNGLLVAQVGLSVALVAIATLFGNNLSTLQQVETGFDSHSVITMRVALNENYVDPQSSRRITLFKELLERIQGLPGVHSAAIGRDVPLSGGPARTRSIVVPSVDSGEATVTADLRIVSPEYFATLGLSVVQGRGFVSTDNQTSARVAVVNEAFAERYWPNRNAVGQIFMPSPDEGARVIGVVSDVHHYGLDQPAVPEYYFALYQRPLYGWHLFVRGDVEPRSLVRPVIDSLHQLDRDLPVHMIQSLDEVLDRGLAPPRFRARIVGLFGVIALLVTCIGVFGLTAYSVSSRLREIGIRLALGAQTGTVVRMVLGETMTLAALGLSIGIAVTFVFRGALERFLFETSFSDPVNWLVPGLIVLVSALTASYWPARRAANANPSVVLRN